MKKKFSKHIIGVVILIAIVTLGIKYFTHKSPEVKAAPSPLVKLSKVLIKATPDTASATALIAANQKATLMPKIGGYIEKLNFQEGQFVKKGQALIELNNTAQMQAYLADQAATQFAKVTMQRYQKLLKLNYAAKQNTDQYLSEYKKALAKENADKSALKEMTLRAPISGYVGTTTFNVGDFVNIGNSIVTITDTDHLKVEYSLPSFYTPKLKLGQKVKIAANFLPKEAIVGKVSYIAPIVNQDTQTIEVHAVIDNTNHFLKPGQSVNVIQYLGETPHNILVPSDAIIPKVSGDYVYVIKNNKVIAQPVVTGTRYHGYTVIDKGLQANTKIVVVGQFQIQPGQQVRIIH